MSAMKLPKAYEPKDYESDIYALWEQSRAFTPKNRGGSSFSIVVPPPNANGNLHLGHGLTLAIEDIATRYHRMKGDAALLLPGADHAGFETQVVYEKELAKEGRSRFDFSREELYSQIMEFVQKNRGNYETQFRQLGASVDWEHYTFTLDNKIIKTAYKTFKKMWDEGLIYRGERLVNFCTFHGTAFADIEVAYKEVKGHLWHIRYPLTDGSGEVTVATTRPETLLGDVAVAVHPDDKRYAKFIGKTVKLPLTNREIPILADEMVDTSFGTGAVKITPAHDQNDYDVAQRHDLPMITVIDQEGKMDIEAGEAYRGLPVMDARKQVIVDLETQGFLVKTEDHTHNVGHCYKCGNVLQPLLRDQWFIDMKPLTAPAIEALKAGKVTFYPEVKKEQLIRYLEGLRDWNISRQIAWGIPIPAFQNVAVDDDWIFDERVTEETITVDGKTYRRDPDVFDTWFSSSQWPYATLDFPDGEDFKQFYPLSVMETGADILYPWVSRMLMLGLYITGEVPFKSVYLHGLILDENGQKMSKSKGNVIDPMEKISQYGSDAFRMGIIAGESAGSNRPYDESKIVGGRNFANKLWNVARYVEDKLPADFALNRSPEPQSTADHWMLTRLQHITEVVSQNLDAFRFGEAYDAVYHLLWDDFADWYIEASKAETNRDMLAYGLEAILKLTHPFAPFVTETIWQTLDWEKTPLITSSWPEINAGSPAKTKQFEELQTIVSELRLICTSAGLQRPVLHYQKDSFMEENALLIAKLANLGAATEAEQGTGLQLTQTKHHAWLQIDSEALAAYQEKLAAQQADQEKLIAQLEGRLKNKSYVENAPEAVVTQTRDQLTEAKAVLTAIIAEQARFNS